ncbi:hypothetical protein [Pontixanthobacter aquaemixtae]|uniref:Uncharacterized protein n=1 Tax=Pontixanthobacter aquaemixtae TaxID=1958940 RepID=A0A844ZVA1_9SPHN|nr:hypothetical protein [Pontixanthobacter aquaemixtae]MXO91668.1 hypothetical protein [Pontixanthobacter aquaemixtae]
MTLGQYLPIMALIAGLVVAISAIRRLRAIPSPGEPDYDEEASRTAKSGAIFTLAAALALPILMYVAVPFMGDVADMTLF